MDSQETEPSQGSEQSVNLQGFDPRHLWATPEQRVDMVKVREHQCMRNVKQIGRHIHCFDGNHGFRLPEGKRLVAYDDQGKQITRRNMADVHHYDIVPVVPLTEEQANPKVATKA